MKIIGITNRKLCKNDFFSQTEYICQNKSLYALILREKDLNDKEYKEYAVKCRDICNKYNILFFVNTKIDVALKLKIKNIQLSFKDFIKNKDRLTVFENVGVSVHSLEEAKIAEGNLEDWKIRGLEDWKRRNDRRAEGQKVGWSEGKRGILLTETTDSRQKHSGMTDKTANKKDTGLPRAKALAMTDKTTEDWQQKKTLSSQPSTSQLIRKCKHFLIAGHIFQTDCKKELKPRGIDFLKNICDNIKMPIYAIGGINEKTIKFLDGINIAGVCMMSELMKNTN